MSSTIIVHRAVGDINVADPLHVSVVSVVDYTFKLG
jgi:hypothetical protein